MTPKDSLQNPWAGLASYEDPAISKRQLLFCGRDAESYDVARLIDNNFVITLYGRSGIGKTSLIQAGVFPLLRREQYTPLVVRFGIRSDVTRSFQDLLTDAIENSLRESGGTVRVINVVDEQTDRQAPDYLWNYFARRQFIHADGGVTFPVAVFDQFEEVFRKPDDRQQAETLLAQLRYLADETHALPDRIVDGQPYSYDFNFRFVLVIREDDLYRLEDSIDNCSLATLKQFRYRLRPLSDECTRSVITIPGAGLFVEAEQEHIVSTIKEIARNKEDDSVSTNILSLICNRIFEAYRKSSSEYITSELVETFVKGNPFEQFYKDATDVCQLTKKEKIYIEENFVDSSGRRDSVSENDFFSAVNTERGKQLLEGNMRILQRSAVSSSEGNARIELLHDSFCEPLKKMNEQRKKKQRIGKGVAIGTIILLCDIIFFCVVGIYFSYRKLEESQARFIAEKVMSLKEDNPWLAQLLALEVLTDRPDVKEAEVAFREASLYCSNIVFCGAHEYAVYSASFSPDGRRIVSASVDKTIRIWDAATGDCLRTLEGHTDDVWSASFSPDGRRIVSASVDKTVRIWDAATGDCLRTLEGHTSLVKSASFSPDGRRIVSASWDKTVRIWDAATGECIRTLEGHKHFVESASFSPDGRRIVSASWDNTVRIWDAATGECIRTLEGHTSDVNSASFSPDGRRIVSASSGKTVRIWDAATGDCLRTLEGHSDYVNSASFSPDGHRIVSASYDKTVRIWDAATGECLRTLKGHTSLVNSASFSPDGRRIVSASYDRTIALWEFADEIRLPIIEGHTSLVKSASFSPDGRRIVSASWDKTVRIWDAATGECLRTLEGHWYNVTYASFSPDGNCVASAAGNGMIRIWDAATGECIRFLIGHTGYINSVVYSPDGTRIVSAADDNTIHVWDAESGDCIAVLGHADEVNSAFFSPDGSRIVSASADGAVRIWENPLPLQTLMDETRERFKNRPLTEEERRKYYLN